MTRRSVLRVAFPLLLVAGLGASEPSGCGVHAALYALLPESTFTRGCFAPCMCPILPSQGVQGSFALFEATSDPSAPFRDFDVLGLRWEVELDGTTLPITGSGHYRVGGEVAVEQRLELDLQVGDAPVQHFDSGLVAGGGDFPNLAVQISVNGGFCYDTVIDLVAKPLRSNL